MIIIEFRTNSESEFWARFYPPVRDPQKFVEDRNREYGWTKYRAREERKRS